MDGPETTIGTSVELAQPMRDDQDVSALLDRMNAVPAYFDNHAADLRRGLAPEKSRVPVEKAIDFRLARGPGESSPFAAAAKRLPAPLRKKRLPQILAAVKTRVYPAYRRYRDFLKTEILPRTRSKRIGLGNLPGGAKSYRYAIGFHTTLDATPEKLHAVGLEQLAGIEREMKAIARRAGAGSVRSFLHRSGTIRRISFDARRVLKPTPWSARSKPPAGSLRPLAENSPKSAPATSKEKRRLRTTAARGFSARHLQHQHL